MIAKDRKTVKNGELEERLDITEIALPHGIRRIGEYAFCGCSELRKISLPNGIERIGSNAFLDCDRLEYHVEGVCRYLGNEENPYLALIDLAYDSPVNEIVIPDGVKIIADSAFYCCFDLKKLVLPDSLEHIGSGAFYRCENLSELTVGRGLRSIGRNALNHCDSLTDLSYRGSEDEWHSVRVAAGNSALKKARINFVTRKGEILYEK